MIHCALGCGSVPGTTGADWKAHYANVHLGVHDDGRTPEQWETAAEYLIRAAAATGQEFTVADVLAPLGPHPTPGRRQYVNGQITNRLAGDHVITHVDAQKSTKETTRRSLVYRWRGRQSGDKAA